MFAEKCRNANVGLELGLSGGQWEWEGANKHVLQKELQALC